MSKTDHVRPRRTRRRTRDEDCMSTRQPRPAPRRQGTRHGVIAAARKEG